MNIKSKKIIAAIGLLFIAGVANAQSFKLNQILPSPWFGVLMGDGVSTHSPTASSAPTVNYITATSTTATSTYSHAIKAPCFSVDGNSCLSTSGFLTFHDEYTHPSPGVSATTSSIQAPIIDAGGQVFNVKAYGAKGDGVTDDTTAIQNCINALPANGGECLFPDGQYEISTTLVIKKHGVTLSGTSFSSTFADQSALQPGMLGTSVIVASSTLGFPTNIPMIKVGELGTSKLWTGGGLYNMVLRGTKDSLTPGDCIQVENIQAYRIINNGLTKCNRGVYIASDQPGGVSNVDIEHNITYYNNGPGIFTDTGSDENYVRFNYVSGSRQYGIHISGIGNTVTNNHVEGATPIGSGTADGTAIFADGMRSFIYENDIITSDRFGIYVNNSHTIVESNHINNPNGTSFATGAGIWVAGSPTDISVIGNNINDNDGNMVYGIYDTTDMNSLYLASNNITGEVTAKIFSTHDTYKSGFFMGGFGIGTTTPNFGLSLTKSLINGYFGVSNLSQGDIFTINALGNVGIGTTTPDSTFSIIGGIKLYSLLFSGAQSIVLNSTTSIPNLDQPITISGYVYPKLSSNDSVVSIQSDNSSTNIINVVYDAPNGRFSVFKSGGIAIVSTTTSPQPSLNTWYEFAYTYNGTVNSLYINGVLQATSSTSHPTGSPNVIYFARTAIGQVLHGSLDNIRIWNSALTSSQIASMYNSYANTPRTGLVGEWMLNEGSGTSVLDSSGSGNTGTIGGGATFSTNISGESQPLSVISDLTALGNATSSLKVWTSGEVDGGFFNSTISTSTFKGVALSNILSCNTGAAALITDSSGNIGCGSISGSGISALGSGYASTTNTTVTFSTSTLSFNGLTLGQTITATAGALTLTPIVAGVLNLAGGGTATTTFYSGGLIYSDSSKLTQSSLASSMFWDETNKRLGIGSSSPSSSALDIQTIGRTALRLDNNQNDKYIDAFSAGTERFSINYQTNGTLELQSFGGAKMVLNDQGNNVSIGTSNNGSPLTINGATTIGTSYSTLAAPTNGLIVSGNVGLSTSTSYYNLTVASTTGSQLSLSAGAGIAQWAFRNAGGNLYFSTTTVAGNATSSTSGFNINGITGNIGMGTDTPYANLSVQSNLGTGNAFVVATSTGAQIGGMDNDGHRFSSGPAPAISSCGTGTGTVVGDDQSGTITTATAATACTATFSKAYRNTPVCTVTDNSLVGFADVASISTTAVTFGISSALTGGNLYYNCIYHQ